MGGTASNIATESQMNAKFGGILEFEEIRTTSMDTEEGPAEVVIGRQGEIRILDEKTRNTIIPVNIPYGAHLFVNNGQKVEKGDRL